MAPLIPGLGVTELIICSFPLLVVVIVVVVVTSMNKKSTPAARVVAAGRHPDPSGRHELRY